MWLGAKLSGVPRWWDLQTGERTKHPQTIDPNTFEVILK